MNTALKLQSDEEQKLVSHANELISMADRCVIFTDQDNEKASDLVKFIKTAFKKSEDDRKSITDPLNAVIKNINARYKQFTDPLANAETKVKTLMLAYSQEKRRKQAEEERIAREQEQARLLALAEAEEAKGDVLAAETAIEQAVEVEQAPTQVQTPATVRGDFGSTSSVKKTWTFEVTDIKALANANPALVIENSVAIREQIRQGVREIPGVKIYEKESIAVR